MLAQIQIAIRKTTTQISPMLINSIFHRRISQGPLFKRALDIQQGKEQVQGKDAKRLVITSSSWSPWGGGHTTYLLETFSSPPTLYEIAYAANNAALESIKELSDEEKLWAFITLGTHPLKLSKLKKELIEGLPNTSNQTKINFIEFIQAGDSLGKENIFKNLIDYFTDRNLEYFNYLLEHEVLHESAISEIRRTFEKFLPSFFEKYCGIPQTFTFRFNEKQQICILKMLGPCLFKPLFEQGSIYKYLRIYQGHILSSSVKTCLDKIKKEYDFKNTIFKGLTGTLFLGIGTLFFSNTLKDEPQPSPNTGVRPPPIGPE